MCGAYGRLRFGVPDLLCGAKAFRADLYERHSQAMEGNTIGTGLAVAALRAGNRPALIPIPVVPRAGHSRFGTGLRPNLRILRAVVNHLAEDVRSVAYRRRRRRRDGPEMSRPPSSGE